MKLEYLFEVTETLTHLCSVEIEVPDDEEWAAENPLHEDTAWQELESQMEEDGNWRDTIVETEDSNVEIFGLRDVYEVLD
jgi:hypothetical protein